MNTQTRSSYAAGCQTQTCCGNNVWIFGPLSKSECNTHRFVHLFIKQSDKAAKNIVGAAFGPVLCTNTTLSLPLALSAVLGGVTVGFFLAAPASVRASAPLTAAQRTSQSTSCCILSSLSATSCHSGPSPWAVMSVPCSEAEVLGIEPATCHSSLGLSSRRSSRLAYRRRKA